MIVTYLLPTVWAGKVPMQYRIEKRKKDMRTRFCRDNERYIIDRHVLDAMIHSFPSAREKGNRLFFKNEKAAYKFSWILNNNNEGTINIYHIGYKTYVSMMCFRCSDAYAVINAFSGIIMCQGSQSDCRDYCKRKQTAYEMSIKG